MNLLEMRKKHEAALAKAESILQTAQAATRELTANEISDIDTCTTEATALEAQIRVASAVSTIRERFPRGGATVVPANEANANDGVFARPRWQTREYANAFATYMQSRGRVMSETLALGDDGNGGFFVPFARQNAASYEGGSTSGAPIVPSQIEQTIIPLSAPVMAMRSLATVIPTSMDIKLPRKLTHGTAASKAESGGSNNAFGGADPTMEQFTLSAFMVGHIADISWELAQDVPAFLAYLQEDELLSIAELEESYFVAGTGSGQAQGIKGNVATGVTGVLVGTDNYAEELLAASFDVQSLLPPVYDSRANWLMRKSTGIVMRKQQFIDNKYNPVWVRSGNQDFFHGYAVNYSDQVDAIAASAVPMYFGDFKSGYIIGDRGGSGVSVKILDQPKASLGLLQVLSYRRVDGRVRRSEAIQPITLHS
jgi:HK97 family phage major capsid protein